MYVRSSPEDAPFYSLDPPSAIQEYASMLKFFLMSEFVGGNDIIAVGHSASTSAW